MKISVTLVADPVEEPWIKYAAHINDVLMCIQDAKQLIRARIKYSEGVTESESSCLEEIRQALDAWKYIDD